MSTKEAKKPGLQRFGEFVFVNHIEIPWWNKGQVKHQH